MSGTAFNPATWSGYDEATVSNPSSALTDFTLLIDVSTLSASWKAAVQSDGADIRLTKGDGTTELAYDLIGWAYNSGAPTGWIRALWSGSLASSGSQRVRVWAGYTGGTAVAYDASETHGSDNAYDANWLAYWPFEESSGDFIDRTSYGHDAGSVTGGHGGTGKVGGGWDVAGSYRATVSSSSALENMAPVSIMVWTSIDGNSNMEDLRIVDRGINGGDDTGLQLTGYGAFHNNGVKFKVMYSGFSNATVRCATNFWTGTGGSTGMHHFAATWNGTSAPKMYVAGVNDSQSASAPSGARMDDSASTMYLGNSFYANRDWPFVLDDLQIHGAERSAEWIAEEYDQSNDQAGFWGSWAWTSTGGGSSIAPHAMHYARMRSAA